MDVFLVIDDEQMVLDQVSRILKTSFKDSRVLTASNGVDGIRLAREHCPDVIILDVSMPEMDGFATCGRLKADGATSFIPVIIITGVKTDSDSRNKALAVGADDYLYKPFATDDLVFHVKVFLRIRRSEDALRQKKEQFEMELCKRSRELWESEKKFRELAELLPDVVFETDAELNIVYINKAGLRLFGYDESILKTGFSLRQLIVFNARQGEQHVSQALEGKPITAYEYLVRSKDDMKFVARISLAPILDNGGVKGLRGALIDITQFKQIEKQLMESREGFRALFSNMFDSFVVCEVITGPGNVPVDSRFMDVNPAFCSMLGCDKQEIIGKTFLEIFPGAEQNWISAMGQVGLTGVNARFENYLGELGRHLQVSAFSPGRGLVAMVLLDVTEKKIAEEREFELQKETTRAKHFALLASLSGAVAHDLNNVLGPMLCYPDLILLDTPEDAPFKEHLVEIKNSTKRAISIIEDLLSLGRSGSFKKVNINIRDALESYMDSQGYKELKKSFPNLRLTIKPCGELPPVMGHGPRLARVFESLFQQVFALASEDHEIILSVAQERVDKPVKDFLELIPPGEYVVVRLQARGDELDNNNVNEMFDPFGKASGNTKRSLAMALIYSVIRDHDGYVNVCSSEDSGAVFSLYFSMNIRGDQYVMENDTDMRGSEKILVVDDMRNQRLMAEKMLASLGYRVETAMNGQDAIRIIKREMEASPRADNNHAPFDLVLLDMMMEEDFDGLETFKRILELAPKQKCVIVSGFAKSDRVRQADLLGIKGFVRKPYTFEGIGKVVRNVLDG